MLITYNSSEIIEIMKNKDSDKFRFVDNYAYIYPKSLNDFEIAFELVNGKIPDESLNMAVKILENYDKCMETAHQWLGRLKNADSQRVKGYGICIENVPCGHESKDLSFGFTISFIQDEPDIQSTLMFTVKFNEELRAYAVEESYT